MLNWLFEGVLGDMFLLFMCEMDKLCDFMFFKFVDEKLFCSVGCVKVGEVEWEVLCLWKKFRGNGGVLLFFGFVGLGDGVVFDEKVFIKWLGFVDRVCCCWIM